MSFKIGYNYHAIKMCHALRCFSNVTAKAVLRNIKALIYDQTLSKLYFFQEFPLQVARSRAGKRHCS